MKPIKNPSPPLAELCEHENELVGTVFASASFPYRSAQRKALYPFDSIHDILLLVENRLSIQDKTIERSLVSPIVHEFEFYCAFVVSLPNAKDTFQKQLEGKSCASSLPS